MYTDDKRVLNFRNGIPKDRFGNVVLAGCVDLVEQYIKECAAHDEFIGQRYIHRMS